MGLRRPARGPAAGVRWPAVDNGRSQYTLVRVPSLPMKCLTCDNEIYRPIDEFGATNHPLCQSCWLAGNAWVYNDSKLVDELAHGETLDNAMKNAAAKHITELEAFA
jgi:hypothetical protein